MDGNKDEALKCLKIGKDALESGDRTRGLKFISKASRLDPSLAVDDLLSNLDRQPAPSFNPLADKKTDDSGVRRRVLAPGSASSSSSSASVAYTEEQITIVREVKRKKDYYDILGLEKTCSVEDVRKAYRKLSLKVHPDKNKAPGAEDAFKSVSKAFKCLSVEESRKQYDLVGSDEPVYERRAARRSNHQGFSNGFYYEGDVDAEEIFRNFFFGGMNPGVATQFSGFSFGNGMGARMGGDNGSSGFNARTLIQLLPVILILLLNFMPSNEPVYSLSKTYQHEYRFTTAKGVNYFVKSTKFEQDYPSGSPERVRLEARIEHDYFSILSQNCRMELQRRQWGFIQETPNCDVLRRFESAA